MDRVPRIAVLMTAYNALGWIEAQVNTILAQSDVDIDLYISVDVSIDGTEHWCQRLASQYDNVHLLPYGERFGGAGPNFFRLIGEVSFEGFDYVALADHDDLWVPNKLSRAHNLFLSGGFDAVSSDVEAFWVDGRQKLIKKSHPQRKYDHFFEAAGPGCTYVLTLGCALAFKKFLILNWDACSRVALHDWLIYAFCRENGYSWCIDDSPLVLYRQHGLNQIGSNSGWRAFWKRFQLIRSRWYRQQVLLIAFLVNKEFCEKVSGRLFLMRNFFQLRRRLRDRWVILFMIVFGFF